MSKLDELLENRKELDYAVELNTRLARLENNDDFKVVIMTNYLNELRNAAIRTMVDPNLPQSLQIGLLEQVKATALLENYFERIKSKAQEAKGSLVEVEQLINEALNSEA